MILNFYWYHLVAQLVRGLPCVPIAIIILHSLVCRILLIVAPVYTLAWVSEIIHIIMNTLIFQNKIKSLKNELQCPIKYIYIFDAQEPIGYYQIFEIQNFWNSNPSCPESLRKTGVTQCSECEEGILYLDPSSKPKWRLSCNNSNCSVKIKKISSKENKLNYFN